MSHNIYEKCNSTLLWETPKLISLTGMDKDEFIELLDRELKLTRTEYGLTQDEAPMECIVQPYRR